jgi:1-deoxy-D-xylulose-5-phosphate reductoisomerase
MTVRLAILGATGSIGSQALDVVARIPDQFEVVALASGRGGAAFEATAARHPRATTRVGGGSEELVALIEDSAPDLVLVATTGLVALPATLAALEAGAAVAIANKETIVAGGAVVLAAAHRAAAERGSSVLERLRPVDSEHSALWQCLAGEDHAAISRLCLTASGGPFRTWSAEQIAQALPSDALAHPTWSMGAKITIDSASLVNKGLEVIEAHRLFSVPMEQIDIVVHPESCMHALVEFIDGSTKAQLGEADMRGPIAYALGYPTRFNTGVRAPRLAERASLNFEAPDYERFPGLALALEAGRRGGSAPGTLIAADDVAVSRFLTGELRFGGIPALIDEALSRFGNQAAPADAAMIMALDDEVRTFAAAWNPPVALLVNARV